MNWTLSESSDDNCDIMGQMGGRLMHFWDAIEFRDSWVWGAFVEETIHVFVELVFKGGGEVLQFSPYGFCWVFLCGSVCCVVG